MSKFLKGEKIECIRIMNPASSLVLGRVYIVRKCTDLHVYLEHSGTNWTINQFKTYKPKVNPKDYYNKY